MNRFDGDSELLPELFNPLEDEVVSVKTFIARHLRAFPSSCFDPFLSLFFFEILRPSIAGTLLGGDLNRSVINAMVNISGFKSLKLSIEFDFIEKAVVQVATLRGTIDP